MAKRAPVSDPGRVCVAHGPLEVERCLERDARTEIRRVRADPGLLAQPVLIIVPSRSLRLHVGRRLLHWSGTACAGFRVVTLFGLARELCAASGTAIPRGARLFDPLVEEALHGAGALGTELERFEDGALVAGLTVADLVDAGFEPARAPALLERLDAAAQARVATARELARARALVEVTTRVARTSAEMGVGRPSQMLRCATAALGEDPRLLRARGVWIHGFSDATGAAADLLAKLAEHPSARIFWDACADGAFGRELRLRLGVDADVGARTEAAPCTLVRASRVDAEVRAVADRIKALLDGGAEPERIGVVARDLFPYRVALRRHLGRLSIPFSGQDVAGPDGPAERSAKALAVCVAEGAETPIDRWYDARSDQTFADRNARPYELRIAMRALGLGTLGDLATLDVDDALEGRAALALPLRGITTAEAEPDDEAEEAEDDGAQESQDRAARPAGAIPRRTVSRDDLQREAELARTAVDLLEALPDRAPAGAHLDQLPSFVERALGWDTGDAARAVFDAAVGVLRADLPGALPLRASAFRAIFEREITAQAAQRLGGAGGGIACLQVVEARARTFDTLFVLGLVRGRFPRNVREDPLLSDALRGAWAAVLPHLAQKSVGRDEERALFDQLVRSAPHVHLSWLTLDEESKAQLPSALLERVAAPQAIAAAPLAPDPLAPASPERAAVARPAHEHAAAAALRAGIDGLAQVLPAAVEETRTLYGLEPARSAAVSNARIAILREHEPADTELGTLGPYFGLIGSLRTAQDLRAGDLHVTQLESVAACGWKALLTRVLRIEPPLDPLATLPDLDARLVGDVVHAVLQVVVAGMSERVQWPAPATVETILRDASHAALRERGIFVPGFETLVAARARPMLDAARELDASEADSIRRAASEVNGQLDLPEGLLGARHLRFRADRVDDLESAQRGTDYKTGSPLNSAQGAETRLKHHLDAIARGDKLQAMAYARSAGDTGLGRYVFLAEGVEAHKRVFEIGAANEQARAAFDDALEVLLGAFDMGVLFPRLLTHDTHQANPRCASCEMAQACLRGDSGANRRLARFVALNPRDETAQEAALKLWSLASAKAAAIPKAQREPKPKRKKRGEDGA